jgi:hypothetical protein
MCISSFSAHLPDSTQLDTDWLQVRPDSTLVFSDWLEFRPDSTHLPSDWLEFRRRRATVYQGELISGMYLKKVTVLKNLPTTFIFML